MNIQKEVLKRNFTNGKDVSIMRASQACWQQNRDLQTQRGVGWDSVSENVGHSGQWTMVQCMTYWHISKASNICRRILSEENVVDICKISAMEDVTRVK